MRHQTWGASRRVRDLIATTGLTHREIATATGLTPDKLSKSLAEPAQRRFTTDDILNLARLFHTTTDRLLGSPATLIM